MGLTYSEKLDVKASQYANEARARKLTHVGKCPLCCETGELFPNPHEVEPETDICWMCLWDELGK